MRIRYLTFTLVLLTATTPATPRSALRPNALLRLRSCRSRPSILNASRFPSFPRITSTYDPEDRDYLIRTIVFEASEESEEGKAAVAHVILNRERSGRWGESIKQVVTRPWQFEPWMTRRSQMVALSQSDPRYQGAARIADAVLSGQIPDQTAGATHFLNPTIVRKRRGGSLPAWAQGAGQPIGQHTFYAPNGGVPVVELYPRASHGRFGHIPSSMLWA